MYSPDSTFGIRPYLSKAEDRLKIVNVMKLYDQRRFDHHSTMNDGSPTAKDMSYGYGETAINGTADYATEGQHSTLFFSSKKTTLTDKSRSFSW